MGTTASTAQQTVSAGTSLEGLQGSGSSMDGQHSLSVQSFHATSLHNSKAKSIIPNKVAPVVITYNCKEEFQIHDELLKAHYRMGRLSDATPEHYLVQVRAVPLPPPFLPFFYFHILPLYLCLLALLWNTGSFSYARQVFYTEP